MQFHQLFVQTSFQAVIGSVRMHIFRKSIRPPALLVPFCRKLFLPKTVIVHFVQPDFMQNTGKTGNFQGSDCNLNFCI